MKSIKPIKLFKKPVPLNPLGVSTILSQLICIISLGLTIVLPVQDLPAGQSKRGNALPVSFRDVSHLLRGFTHNSDGGDAGTGVAWLDYDNDGWLDFYVANGIGHNDGLMHNNGDSTFENRIDSAGFGDANGSSGVVAGDLNNDGFTDLIVAGEPAALVLVAIPSPRSIRIFRNNGNGTFSDVTAKSGITIPNEAGAAMQPVLGDIDNDGLLDLYGVKPRFYVA